MIIRVFPQDEYSMSEDFSSFQEAFDYVMSLDCDCEILVEKREEAE